jgi:plastocyanin
MRRLLALAVLLVLLIAPGHGQRGTGAGGTIKGRIQVTGKAPGNMVVRMGMDPMCSRMYTAGNRPVEDAVVIGAKGGLSGAFVKVEGAFPKTPVPAQPVVVDQRGCFFVPRVVGARVGQTLRVTNGDMLLHNVRSQSAGANAFNIAQPMAGMQHDFVLKAEELIKLTCDLHRWMVSYVAVIDHPYFAVSGEDGSFTIANVPPGRRTIRVWHERLGELTQTVDVKSGAASEVTFSYSQEKGTAK